MDLLLRPLYFLRLELKSSLWVACAVPLILAFCYGYFTFVFLQLPAGTSLEYKFWRLSLLDEMSGILPLVAATLWAYLFAGSSYSAYQDTLFCKDRHSLSKMMLRSGVSFALMLGVCAGLCMLLIPEFTSEIALLSARTLLSSLFCMLLLATGSYFFKSPALGLVLALSYSVISFSTLQAFWFCSPFWHTPAIGFEMSTYFILMLCCIFILVVALLLGERFVRKS